MKPNADFDRPEAPPSILIVDDRAGNRLALRAVLQPLGLGIVEASSGEEALRRLLEQEFAVLLLDVVMPEMSGLELASLVRARERTAAVPILFLTGEATDREVVTRAYELGAADYLVKPLVPETVRAKVETFVELYRRRKQVEQQAARLVEAERREAELTLLELKLATERRYKSLADAVPHMVWTADAAGGAEYVNRRWSDYVGNAREPRAPWTAALHEGDVERCTRAWREALEHDTAFDGECRVRRADGAYRWHLCRAVPERGDDGRIASWVVTFTDIDDERRARAELAEFRGTLDAVLDAVLMFEPDSLRLTYVNAGAVSLWRRPREALLGARAHELVPALGEAALGRIVAELGSERQATRTVETRARRSDGVDVPVELRLQHIRLEAARIVVIARDVTERKRSEAERERLYQNALEAVRARDEFLSIASHELRTPLTTLRLQLDALGRAIGHGPPAPPLDRSQLAGKLAVALRQVERLARLTGELLDVSRMRAGKLELDYEELDLSSLVREVVARFADVSARARSPIVVRTDGPASGRWDRARLEQAVTNLLSNALKFGAERPVEVEVEGADASIAVRVRDHGAGIAPKDFERIFERFERAASPRAYGGLGLGLYIVRQIVEAHGGKIGVSSDPTAGTVFELELPREPPPLEVDHHEAEASDASATAPG